MPTLWRCWSACGLCLSFAASLTAHPLAVPVPPAADRCSSDSVPAVAECIRLAEACQLDSLYTKCVVRLAARLCTPGGGGDGFAQAAALAGLGQGTLLLTLGAVAEAAKRTCTVYRHP